MIPIEPSASSIPNGLQCLQRLPFRQACGRRIRSDKPQ
ncbi:hypothetical protein S7335_3100 [Synechococcus sp. PCC 7335]|nr:hypothetical protein S7335_3100 [Synechococcus sp. PCC 7335]